MSQTILKEKISYFSDEKEIYLHTIFDQISSADCWVVAYSGGKDSTLLLNYAIKYAIRMNKSLVIISSDTLVENPLINSHVKNTLEKIDRYLSTQKILYQIKIVSPEPYETFWVHVIGKGYPLPHIRFRWCQRVLKIKPVERYIKSLKGSPVILLGHRMDESNTRRRLLSNNENLYKKYGKIPVFMPLLYFTEHDVWNEFLVNEFSVWGDNFTDLINLYKDAKGECPLLIEKNIENKVCNTGCGGRFGCWVCSLVKDDKTMANLVKKYRTFLYYYEFRKWLINFCNNPENRYPYTRTGKPVRMGCLSHEARKMILKKLYELQEKIQNNIISKQEIEYIYQCWEVE